MRRTIWKTERDTGRVKNCAVISDARGKWANVQLRRAGLKASAAEISIGLIGYRNEGARGDRAGWRDAVPR